MRSTTLLELKRKGENNTFYVARDVKQDIISGTSKRYIYIVRFDNVTTSMNKFLLPAGRNLSNFDAFTNSWALGGFVTPKNTGRGRVWDKGD
jgi:hypothetical protein